MLKSRLKGFFVTVDGPNGVGKSSLVNAIVSQLKQLGFDVSETGEPTNSQLGRLVRQAETIYNGRVYTCLIAADRYFHIETEIIPLLNDGKIVLSTRYVESSLALQNLDGVEFEFIWAINSQIYKPDLSVILTASAEILESRLSERSCYSRFEKSKTRQAELDSYMRAAEFLSTKGFNILLVDNGTVSLEQNATRITEKIVNLLNQKGE
jgi:dTMP kinase